MANGKRLTRSTQDKMIGGVCGGIASYVGVDTTLVRVGFVLFGVFGAGVLVYLLLWAIVPREDLAEQQPKDTVKEGVDEMRDAANAAIHKIRDTFGSGSGAA